MDAICHIGVSMSRNIQIQGMDALLARLKNIPGKVTGAVKAKLADGARSIAAEAKQRAPADQSILRNEIGASPLDYLHYQVFSGAEYSPFVEFGTLSKVSIPAGLEDYAAQFKAGGYSEPSGLSFKEAIFEWCRRHSIDEKLWYAIYVSIGINGIEPQPFFFPAVAHQTPIIIDNVAKAVEEAV